jgi:ATP-dependent RNA helicase RhlE
VPTEPDPEPTPGSEREVLDVITPKPVRTRGRPAGKVAQGKAHEETDESGDEVPAPRKADKGKDKAKAKTESESEPERGEPSGAAKKRKKAVAKSSKPPSKQKRKASPPSDENDSEQSDHSATPQATKKDRKGKGRAVPASQTTSTEPPAIGKGKGGSISAAIGTNAGKGKSSRRGEKGNSSEEETQPKKKKKLFPQAQPMSFAWDSLPKVSYNVLSLLQSTGL